MVADEGHIPAPEKHELAAGRLHRGESFGDYEIVDCLSTTLISGLYRNVPSGVGKKGSIKLSPSQMDQVLEKGVAWAVKQGYGTREDLEHIEEGGAMAGAEARAVSSRAKERGKNLVWQ